MTDKTKMDIRLKIVEDLYEGDGRLAERVRMERPDLSNELESMQSMKSALDARPPRKPQAAALSTVLRAAADASAGRQPDSRHPGARQDRPPQSRRALYLRSAGVATAVLTVLIAVTTVWQSNMLDGSLPPASDAIVAEDTANERASVPQRKGAGPEDLAVGEPAQSGGGEAATLNPAENSTPMLQEFARSLADEPRVPSTETLQNARVQPEEAGSFFRRTGPDARRRPSDILPVGMRPVELAVNMDRAAGSDVPGRAINEDLAWDQSADVMEMHQQIEMIGGGVDLGWEPPSVPLEMVPAYRQARPSGIQPAGERRDP